MSLGGVLLSFVVILGLLAYRTILQMKIEDRNNNK